MKIQHNKNIFAAYVGLIIGGYNLLDTIKNEKIYNKVKNIKWDSSIADYFSKAKSYTCEVNAYYPKAFYLTLASLYVDEVYYEFNKLEEYISKLPINPVEKDENAMKWLQQLPVYLAKVFNNKEFDAIWKQYLAISEESDLNVQNIIDAAMFKIGEAFKVKKDDFPQILIVPNRLQAPEAADVAYKTDVIYIINPEPNEESIIHEYLHCFFDRDLEVNRSLINKYLYLLKPVLKVMIKYQYAWDYNLDSWNRVFEESFMRAASIWVSNYNDEENGFKVAYRYEKYGFIYVPAILKNFVTEKDKLNDFSLFIRKCLQNCCMVGVGGI